MVPLPLAAGPSTAITGAASGRGERAWAWFKPSALTAPYGYGKARAERPGDHAPRDHDNWSERRMVKPEWGTKRTCPKCATRFYDLGKEDPVHCIECGTDFVPEPVLKSKQPMAFEAAPAKKEQDDKALAGDDLEIDEDEEPSADEEVDLETGDSDLGVETGKSEEDS
jgi:uncharacterized protein (TIGR02300 family)